MTNNPIAGR